MSLFSLKLVLLLGSCSLASLPLDKPPPILVDQFGYRPGDTKVAVIHQANASPEDDRSLYAYLNDVYQVVDLNHSNRVVYENQAHIWKGGEINHQSGDRASWFDFSEVNRPGLYAIRNPRTEETSFPFEISDAVYREVLVTATRMFFYQRSGFAKRPPFADRRWTDDAAFLGPGQDTEARYVYDKENADLERDMRGGWFDAGDTNKYVTFAADSLHHLLTAYSQNPDIWTDDFNIPESGNGIPDLLDELVFELDWLQRMQDEDGGAFIKLGTLDFNYARRPSLDKRPRFYGPKCSSSTIALAGMLAHAALIFQKIPELQAIAPTLGQKAQLSWDWYTNHPQQTDCDSQAIKSGDADRTVEQQEGLAVLAAAYLGSLYPGVTEYPEYLRTHVFEARPFRDSLGLVYELPVVDAVFTYLERPDAPEELRQRIRSQLTERFQQTPDLYGVVSDADPYRAAMPDEQYHWGSNAVKANIGNANLDIHQYGLNFNQSTQATAERALGNLHYLHGVNPLGIVYVSNMYEFGAEFSANEMFHEWFGGGIYNNAKSSPSGPAPGYLTGGPNKNYTGSAPLSGLPPMRAYLDSNKASLSMWEITEPSIVYQGTYVRLLSSFLGVN